MKSQTIRLIDDDDEVEILNEVEVDPRFFNRLLTNNVQIDEIFGGADMPGLLPGSTTLFTGTPGAGKSTFALELADLFSKNKKSVLYNVGEENKQMVKIRADRLHLTGGFCISSMEEIDEVVKYVRANRVEILFQDSLQSMHDKKLSRNAKLLSISKKLCRLSKKENITVIVIGHSVKGGRFAGPQELVHDVDVHAHLALNTENGNRILNLEKNRNGPSAIPYEFVMSASGLDFNPVHQVQRVAAAKTDKKGSRREDTKVRIKELLMEGEKISAYYGEQHPEDFQVSGGFFRGMLAVAARELESEGHQVREMLIAGRRHTYLEDRQK